MKVALVHDWLTGFRGGERCLEAFLQVYPEADVFTLVHVPGSTTPQIDARVKGVSFLQRIPGIARLYRAFLGLYPAAASSLSLDGYDLVISLSHAAAKNVVVPSGVTHVCYCFTPMRYIWDQARSYFRGITFYLAQPLIRILRRWDSNGAQRVTHFVAISTFVAARIRRFYGRAAVVIPPPVRMQEEVRTALAPLQQDACADGSESFFLCAGALVPYKRIDVAIQAFNQLGLPLWIIGDGPERDRLQALAGPSIRFLGRADDAVLWDCYRRCRALVFPGIEDFGIVPVECLSSGRPVIGVDAGGVGESVRGFRPWLGKPLVPSEECGVFIPKSGFGDPAALMTAVQAFSQLEGQFATATAKARASHFSYQRFYEGWGAFARNVGIDPGLSDALAQSHDLSAGSSERSARVGVC
jgi:glycosyltransferase involved in cell wall biosynthesis